MVLVTSAAGVLQFLNLGLNISLMRFVSALHSRGNQAELQTYVGNAYFLAAVGNGTIAVLLFGVGLWGQPLLDIAPDQAALFRDLMLILGIATLLNGLLNVPRGILEGLQRFDLRTLFDLGMITGPLWGLCAVWLWDFDLRGFMVVNQSSALCGGLLSWGFARRLLPGIKHGPSLNKQAMRKTISFNLFQAGNQVADMLFHTTDKIVLQRVLGTASVADYAIVEKPTRLSESLLSQPMSALIPASSRAYAQEDAELIRKLFERGTQIYVWLVLPPLVTLWALMPHLLRLWVGNDFVHLAGAARLFLLIPLIGAPFRVFGHMMTSKGRVREQVSVKLTYAPVNVIVSVVLARRLGIIGVILPSVFFWVLIYPTVWIRLLKQEGIRIQTLMRSTLRPGLPIVLGGIAMAILVFLNPPAGFLPVLLISAGGTCVMYASAYAFGLEPATRLALRSLVTGSNAKDSS